MPRSRKSDDEEVEKDEIVPGGEEDDADEPGLEIPAEPEDDDEVDLEEVPASAAGKASAARLLDLLVEKKALALHVKKASNALIEGVARVLESPLPVKQKATKLTDTIVDSDDVDDFFLDDETLIELLKRW